MRTLLIAAVLSGLIQPAYAQFFQNKIESYDFRAGDSSNSVVIEMPYAKTNVIKITGDTSALREAGELTIEIVCTDYPSYASLELLNRTRLSA